MKQSNKVDAPIALVTGAAMRIGAQITQTLHQAGFRVLIHCHHSHDQALLLADKMNQDRANSAQVLIADLSNTDEIHALIAAALLWGERLDLLVNNASIFVRDESVDWDVLFHINTKAPYILSQVAKPYLAKTQGTIINITDIHADFPLTGYAVYCQSKAALQMQTKALACEFAPLIRVNAVAPGAIIWPIQDNQLSSEQQQRIIDKTPLKRHGNPEFIAQAVLALVNNAFITGQILRVDGGRGLKGY